MYEIVDLWEHPPSDREIASFFRLIFEPDQTAWNFGEAGVDLRGKSAAELVAAFRENVLNNGNSHQFWAVADGEVVGMAGLNVIEDDSDDRRAGLGFGVSASHQRQGIAAALLARALGRADELGLSSVEAECFADNDRSLGLLRKFGFTQANGTHEAISKRGRSREVCVFVKRV